MLEKECNICCRVLPVSEFYRKRSTNELSRPWCKECSRRSVNKCKERKKNGVNIERAKKDKKVEKAAYKLKKNYGISEDDYQSMFDSQLGKCANLNCANMPVSSNKKRLFVDHNHHTGVVRGLLCHHCNIALGNVDDRIESLVGLIDYLNMHDGTNHGGKVAEAYK